MAKKFLAIGVDSVAKSKLGNLFQAQLRQQVEETYGRRANNSRTDSLFDDADFGEELTTQTYTTTRVAWINVPSSSTVESVAALLAAHPASRIYRILSFDVTDVLTDEQRAVWSNSSYDFDRESVIERMKVRDADGEIVLDPVYKCPMYRQSFFSKNGHEDLDYRAESAKRLGLTPGIETAVDAEAFEKMSAAGDPFGEEA